jgi:hypothetical protein
MDGLLPGLDSRRERVMALKRRFTAKVRKSAKEEVGEVISCGDLLAGVRDIGV